MNIYVIHDDIITDCASLQHSRPFVHQHNRRDVRLEQIADSIENRPLSLDSLILTDRGPATAQKVLICRMVLNQRGRGDADMAAVCAVRLYHKNMTFALPFRQSALQATSQERQVAA